MTLVNTVQSLTGRAAELMTLLRLTCGDCTNCSEECAYRDKSITEDETPLWLFLIGHVRMTGLAGDAKLDYWMTIPARSPCARQIMGLSDVPPELLGALHQSGCCLSRGGCADGG